MSNRQSEIQLFSLATMSGVSPGTRTRIMQRVRSAPLTETHPHGDVQDWLRLLWFAGPDSTDQAEQVQGATCLVQTRAKAGGDQWQSEPLLRIVDTDVRRLVALLQAGLAQVDRQAVVCGTCVHWRPTAARQQDGLPLGECRAPCAEAGATDLPPALAGQSALALACPHWQVAPQLASIPARTTASTMPSVAEPAPEENTAPLPKAAERAKAARSGRWWSRLFTRSAPPAADAGSDSTAGSAPAPAWAQRLEERSGVGAGTEPCFACQGRLANLGALTVATVDDDKQTYSVWRCRSCRTTYLNSWIDRWERLDNLETDETYYRVTPAEALAILVLIDSVAGGDHPAGRHARGQERSWFEDFTQARNPLSHQIKQGR